MFQFFLYFLCLMWILSIFDMLSQKQSSFNRKQCRINQWEKSFQVFYKTFVSAITRLLTRFFHKRQKYVICNGLYPFFLLLCSLCALSVARGAGSPISVKDLSSHTPVSWPRPVHRWEAAGEARRTKIWPIRCKSGPTKIKAQIQPQFSSAQFCWL